MKGVVGPEHSQGNAAVENVGLKNAVAQARTLDCERSQMVVSLWKSTLEVRHYDIPLVSH